MAKVTKFVNGSISNHGELGARQIIVRASNPTSDRAEDVLVPGGCVVRTETVPVLEDHNATVHSLIGRAKPTVGDDDVVALITFADAGLAQNADETCAKAKAGLITDVSVGFDPIECEPIKGGGFRYTKWELLEISMVVIGCNPDAQIIQRALKSNDPVWKMGASKVLEIDPADEWDGPAAAERVLDHFGFNGDEPDAVAARKAFLAYDSANPDLKGSYKLPFADIVSGELKAVKGGIDAAASRLPQADIPEGVEKKARAVLDHYEAKMSDDAKSAAALKTKTGIARIKVKGMYGVAQLAYLLSDLGWLQDDAQWESEIEGDASKLPAMLAGCLADLGAALVAMAQEEVAELIADAAIGIPEVDVAADDAGYILAAKTPAAQKFRTARVKARLAAKRPVQKSGRAISAANEKILRDALDQHCKAMQMLDDAKCMHEGAVKCVKDMIDEDVQPEDDQGQGTDENNDKAALLAETVQLKAQIAQLREAIVIAKRNKAA